MSGPWCHNPGNNTVHYFADGMDAPCECGQRPHFQSLPAPGQNAAPMDEHTASRVRALLPPAAPGTFRPQLGRPAQAVVRRLAQGHLVGRNVTGALCTHPPQVDIARTYGKASWYFSRPALAQLIDQGVLDESLQLTVAGRRWLGLA